MTNDAEPLSPRALDILRRADAQAPPVRVRGAQRGTALVARVQVELDASRAQLETLARTVTALVREIDRGRLAGPEPGDTDRATR